MDMLVKHLALRLPVSMARNPQLVITRSAQISTSEYPYKPKRNVFRPAPRPAPLETDVVPDPKAVLSVTSAQRRGKSGSEVHAQVRQLARNDILTDDEIFDFLIHESRSVRRFYLNHFDYRGRIRARHRNVVFRTDAEGNLVLNRLQLASAVEDWEVKYLHYRNNKIFNFKGQIRQRPEFKRERTEVGRYKPMLKKVNYQGKGDKGSLLLWTIQTAEAFTLYQEEEVKLVEEQLEKLRLERKRSKGVQNDKERKSQVREKED